MKGKKKEQEGNSSHLSHMQLNLWIRKGMTQVEITVLSKKEDMIWIIKGSLTIWHRKNKSMLWLLLTHDCWTQCKELQEMKKLLDLQLRPSNRVTCLYPQKERWCLYRWHWRKTGQEVRRGSMKTAISLSKYYI